MRFQGPRCIFVIFCTLPFTCSFQPSFSRIRQHHLQQIQSKMVSGNQASDDIREEPQHAYTLKDRNPFDVHVYYDNDNAVQRDAAMALRKTLKREFPWMRFYPPKGSPIGPHPIPMWEADFAAYENRDQWTKVRDFLEANNPGYLSILIHPHSTESDYADHTKNAYWVGKPMELLIQGWER